MHGTLTLPSPSVEGNSFASPSRERPRASAGEGCPLRLSLGSRSSASMRPAAFARPCAAHAQRDIKSELVEINAERETPRNSALPLRLAICDALSLTGC